MDEALESESQGEQGILKRIELGLWMVVFWLVVAHVLINPSRADELTDAINQERARHGLPALAHDPNLAAWARVNNSTARAGQGPHSSFWRTPAIAQNSAVNQRSIPEVVGCWMASAAHRVNMLNPFARCCGGSFDGAWWTVNFGNSSAIPNSSPKIVESKPAANAIGTPDNGGAAACSIPYPCQAPSGPKARVGRCGLFRRLFR